jgi:hypothetical protein
MLMNAAVESFGAAIAVVNETRTELGAMAASLTGGGVIPVPPPPKIGQFDLLKVADALLTTATPMVSGITGVIGDVWTAARAAQTSPSAAAHPSTSTPPPAAQAHPIAVSSTGASQDTRLAPRTPPSESPPTADEPTAEPVAAMSAAGRVDGFPIGTPAATGGPGHDSVHRRRTRQVVVRPGSVPASPPVIGESDDFGDPKAAEEFSTR